MRAPKIQVRVASLERLRSLYLEDLSQGGIFIRTEKALPMGSAVEVELVPPDAPPLPLRGSVVRIVNDDVSKREKRAGMAVQFQDLSKDAEIALAVLVTRLREPAPAPTPAAVAPPPSAPDARAGAEDRVSALEMELSDLRGTIEAYQHQQKQLEEDEQTARRLVERLAQEKTELTARAEKGREKSSEELSRLRETLAGALKERESFSKRLEDVESELEALRQAQGTTEAALDAERREHENTLSEMAALRSKGGASESAVDALRAEVRAAKDALEDERRRAQKLQRSVEEERTKAEQARAREREVRNLLSLVSSGNGAPPPAVAAIPEEPWRIAPVDKAREAPPSHEPTAPPPPQPEEKTVIAPSLNDEEAWAMEEPPPEPPPAVAAGLDADFDIAFQEQPAEDDLAPQHENLPVPKGVAPPRPAELAAFAERLRKVGRIVRTERYNAYTPTDPMEILVFDLLSRVESLEDLEKWTQGRVTGDRLVQIVQDFHARSLISLD